MLCTCAVTGQPHASQPQQYLRERYRGRHSSIRAVAVAEFHNKAEQFTLECETLRTGCAVSGILYGVVAFLHF